MYRKTKIATAIALTVAMSAPSIANEDTTEDDVEIIAVTGIRASIAKGLDIKRESDGFEDALVAEDIGKFPDLNLAEALQRIPGITVSRTEGGDQSSAVGEAGSINLRGLSAEFTAVSVNGTQAITPARERGFSFNILASELFSSAVVSKSLNAKDFEGGLAGVVKLSTYKPLDYDSRIVNVGARAVYNSLGESYDPNVTALYVDQLNNGKLGIALGLAYSDTVRTEYTADTSIWVPLTASMRGNADPANGIYTQQEIDAVSDLFIPRDPRNIANNRKHERLNLTFTVQNEISEDFSLTFDGIYAKTDHTGEQIRNDYPIEGFPATFIPDDLVRDGTNFVSGVFPEQSHFMRVLGYDYGVDTTLFQTNLKAEVNLSDVLSMDINVGYAEAEEDFYSWTDVDIRSPNTAIFYEVLGDFVNFTAATPGVTVGDPNSYSSLNQIRARPSLNEDEQLNFNLDFTYLLGADNFDSVKFGIHMTEREKGSSQFEDRRRSPDFSGNIADYLIVKDFSVDGAPQGYPNSILSINYAELVNDVLNQSGNPLNPQIKDTASYEIEESIFAMYAMTNFYWGENISGNIGVRYVTTDQTSSGTGTDSEQGQFPVELESDYSEVLPSLSVKFDATEDIVIRFAAYKSLTRPNLTDISPAFDVNFGTLTGRSGNPNIEPFTATNLDLGFEWYFDEDAAFTVAYFKKNLNGLVESNTTQISLPDPDGQQQLVFVTAPVNGKSADVSGWEIGFTSPFSFLPEPFQNAGIAINATFADSNAEFESQTDANQLISVQLPGLSETSYNAILYYDNDVVSSKLAYNWRTDYLLRASASAGQPLYRDEYGQLDFSFGYSVSENLDLRLDMLNITGEQIRSFTHNDKSRIKGLLETGRTFQVGINYSF
jgi:iron complex outermembrane receptor protein